MTPEIVTIFGNFIGFAVVVYLLQQGQKSAEADREWMKQTLTYLIKRDNPDFDTHSLPGNPPDSRRDIPIQPQ